MKVLLAFPQQDKQTGLSLIRAFEQLHQEVAVIDSKTEYFRLYDVAKDIQPDFIFMARNEELLPDLLRIRKEYPKIITACWNVDVRETPRWYSNNMLTLFNNCHLFYVKPKGMIEAYKQFCPATTIKYLQQGLDPETYKKEHLSETEFKRYHSDVIFIGHDNASLYHTPIGGRKELLRQLRDQREFKFMHINGVYNAEHSKVCQAAKIVIGHCGFANIELSNSVRDFKVLGAGAFLLTEYVKGLETLFNLGSEIETYSTAEECVHKCKYFLKDENTRMTIAENGYKRVLKDHLYVNRIEQVLIDVEGLL